MVRLTKGTSDRSPGPVDQERIVLMAKALADPIRVRILAMLAEGRDCCTPSDSQGAMTGPPGGVCVCDLQSICRLGQSGVSYHLRVLKDAGLVKERARGKWTFYEIEKGAFSELFSLIGRQFRLGP